MSQEPINILSDNHIIELKLKVSDMKDLYKNQTNDWIDEHFQGKAFQRSKIYYEPFTLDVSSDKPYETENENARRVYSNLKHLTDSQASEERLWAGLSLGCFYNYNQYRWGAETTQKILDHYFFNFGPRRSIIRNGISRLWWIGRFTYDESRENPFELTDFLCKHPDFIFHILELNISNNQFLIRTLLQVLIDVSAEGGKINTNHVGDLAKYFNVLGGIYLLDVIPYESLYSKLYTRLQKILSGNLEL
jgi:hypothetical protein